MKNMIYLLFFAIQVSAQTTYYVKSNGGTGNGLDDASAWSYSHFKAQTITMGDTTIFSLLNYIK